MHIVHPDLNDVQTIDTLDCPAVQCFIQGIQCQLSIDGSIQVPTNTSPAADIDYHIIGARTGFGATPPGVNAAMRRLWGKWNVATAPGEGGSPEGCHGPQDRV